MVRLADVNRGINSEFAVHYDESHPSRVRALAMNNVKRILSDQLFEIYWEVM